MDPPLISSKFILDGSDSGRFAGSSLVKGWVRVRVRDRDRDRVRAKVRVRVRVQLAGSSPCATIEPLR